MKLTLPWPIKWLNPNASRKMPRGAKYRHQREYRAACYKAADEQGATVIYRPPQVPVITIIITFCPPDRRARDVDNMVAMFKWGQDALAERLGIDDSFLRAIYKVGEPVKDGAVVVEYEA